MKTSMHFRPRTSTTIAERLRFAIQSTAEVYKAPNFTAWAEGWISGRDRSPEASGEMIGTIYLDALNEAYSWAEWMDTTFEEAWGAWAKANGVAFIAAGLAVTAAHDAAMGDLAKARKTAYMAATGASRVGRTEDIEQCMEDLIREAPPRL